MESAMYALSVTVCYGYANLLIALFVLIISDGSFEPATEQAALMIRDLITIRIWIVISGLLIFTRMTLKDQPTAMVVTVFAAGAWVMFLEDYMVLDGLLFVASHPLAQIVVITRPVFLAALTYLAVKQWEMDLR